MKEGTRLQDLNDIQERKYIIKMIQKLKYSSQIYTEEEINRILNPYGQQYLTRLSDIVERNKPVSLGEILAILYEWKYIRVFDNLCYARKPYTYNAIIPFLKNGRLIGFDEEIVLTSRIECKLQQYCDEKLEKINNKKEGDYNDYRYN